MFSQDGTGCIHGHVLAFFHRRKLATIVLAELLDTLLVQISSIAYVAGCQGYFTRCTEQAQTKLGKVFNDVLGGCCRILNSRFSGVVDQFANSDSDITPALCVFTFLQGFPALFDPIPITLEVTFELLGQSLTLLCIDDAFQVESLGNLLTRFPGILGTIKELEDGGCIRTLVRQFLSTGDIFRTIILGCHGLLAVQPNHVLRSRHTLHIAVVGIMILGIQRKFICHGHYVGWQSGNLTPDTGST